MIQLPNFAFFYSEKEKAPKGNTYYGSKGTDPSRGCFAVKTFNYVVSITGSKEEGFKIHGSTYALVPVKRSLERQPIEDKDAEFTAEGLEEIKAWMEDLYEKFIEERDN